MICVRRHKSMGFGKVSDRLCRRCQCCETQQVWSQCPADTCAQCMCPPWQHAAAGCGWGKRLNPLTSTWLDLCLQEKSWGDREGDMLPALHVTFLTGYWEEFFHGSKTENSPSEYSDFSSKCWHSGFTLNQEVAVEATYKQQIITKMIWKKKIRHYEGIYNKNLVLISMER